MREKRKKLCINIIILYKQKKCNYYKFNIKRNNKENILLKTTINTFIKLIQQLIFTNNNNKTKLY